MSKHISHKALNRRDFLKIGGSLLGLAAGSSALSKALLKPVEVVEAARPAPAAAVQPSVQQQTAPPDLHIAATDGWIYIPPTPAVPPYHPDNQAPGDLTTYIFGFRDVTGMGDTQVHAQKMKAQLVAPIFWIDEGEEFTLKLTNLGLQIRPDLIDAHTLHFHGFRNAIPIFDGEPHSSVGVPIIRDLTYYYKPRDPGTYMYHCHFEETEHVHMGMIGPCYVKPKQNKGNAVDGDGVPIPEGKYAYNDGVQRQDLLSTAYDREYILCLSEIWAEAHWCDSHIQLPEWSDYNADFFLINGRVYPDTLAPNGPGADMTTGELIPPPGRPDLKYQPISSLVQAVSGDRVLLRFINLGYTMQSMTLPGIKMRVIGKDAALLRGRDGTDLTYLTNTVSIGPGESLDAIFIAPEVAEKTTFLLYNRNYGRLNNGGGSGYGGQMTEVHVYPPSGSIAAQTAPNQW